MTKTATAPGSLRAAAFRLAQDLATEAYHAAGQAEAAYRAIAPARAALSDAERAYADAKTDATLRATLPGQLARALGWPLGIVEEKPDTRPWDGPSTTYLAAFGGGRVTSSPTKYHGTPKGRAYGWIIRPEGGRSNDPDEGYTYEPAAGTNNPEKLAAQVSDATANLRAWLSGHTADAWLRAHGIDPQHRPELVSLVSLAIDTATSGYSGERWIRPVWSLTLGGHTIATLDDRRQLLTPDEERAEGYAGVDKILGDYDGTSDDAARENAARHSARARAAMLRRFTYEPEPR